MPHKKNQKKRSTARRIPKRHASKKRGRRSNLASVPMEAIHAEIERRQSVLPALEAKRSEILDEITAIDKELSANSALATGRKAGVRRSRGALATRSRRRTPANGRRKGRKRAANKGSLAGFLQAALNGKTMTISEAADAVRKAGYKTKSDAKNFRTMVNIALSSHNDKFKRVARGQYTAK